METFPMHQIKLPMLFAVMLIVTCGASNATEVYKWRDASGQVHYGQQPPEGATTQRFRIVDEQKSEEEAEGEVQDLMEKAGLTAEQTAAAEKAHEADRQREASAKVNREAECVRSRQLLRKLRNWAKRLLVRDEQGNQHRLDSVDRRAWIADTEAREKQYCD
jgi:hypothetical protein